MHYNESIPLFHIISKDGGVPILFVKGGRPLPEDVIAARLRYRQGKGGWKTLQDGIFPYEFSVWLDDDAGDFEAVMQVETKRLKNLESPAILLKK